jgi:hypothetical protein
MATDPVRRGAARTATFVAVPVAVAVLGISALAFGGFGADEPASQATGPVTMALRELPPDTAAQCQLLISELPTSVAGHAQRPVTAGVEQNAAYGDPPITLECGTAMPTLVPTDEVFNLVATDADGKTYGACWQPVAGDDRTVWTTVDRTVPVTVTVPGPRDGSAQSVLPFSPAIATSIPARDPDAIPTGCGAQPTPS